MDYTEAIGETIRRNGPDRFYRCCQPRFGLAFEETVTPDDLCTEQMFARAEVFTDFEVADAGGAAWILRGGMVAFVPTPIYSMFTQVGVEEPYIWRFDPESLLDQIDDVCAEYGVRLIAGLRAGCSAWRAHFVDTTLTPGRAVHARRPVGYFQGPTLGDAVWRAVRDLRAFNPGRPAAV